jgi:hypothetical protein
MSSLDELMDHVRDAGHHPIRWGRTASALNDRTCWVEVDQPLAKGTRRARFTGRTLEGAARRALEDVVWTYPSETEAEYLARYTSKPGTDG